MPGKGLNRNLVIAGVAGAIAVAAVAFFVLSGGGDSEKGSNGQAGATPTTQAPQAPSVLSSSDYCTGLAELIRLDDEWQEQYDDPMSVPAYVEFIRDAYDEMEDLASRSQRGDWRLVSDAFEASLRDQGATPEQEAAILRLVDDANRQCGIDLTS